MSRQDTARLSAPRPLYRAAKTFLMLDLLAMLAIASGKPRTASKAHQQLWNLKLSNPRQNQVQPSCFLSVQSLRTTSFDVDCESCTVASRSSVFDLQIPGR